MKVKRINSRVSSTKASWLNMRPIKQENCTVCRSIRARCARICGREAAWRYRVQLVAVRPASEGARTEPEGFTGHPCVMAKLVEQLGHLSELPFISGKFSTMWRMAQG